MSVDQASTSCVNEVAVMEVVEEEMEVDLCVVCCSKVENKKDYSNDNNGELLSSNLIVFYLLKRILQVNDNEFKKSLVNCGNPAEWIKFCDKCSELTRQANNLHQNLRRIERELNCLKQLIWDKTKASINSEADRKLVEETINLTKRTGQAWCRIRNHVANKCNSTKNGGVGGAENVINPFIEGDKLANYLITQKVSTAVLPGQHCNLIINEEDDHVSILEETVEEATLSFALSPEEIKIEVKPEMDLEVPQSPDPLDHENYKNLLIDRLLEKLEDDKEVDPVQEIVSVEEIEVDAEGQQNNDQEEDADWNWEPEDDEVDEDDDNEESEVDEGDDLEEIEMETSVFPGKKDKDDHLEDKCFEKGTSSTASAPKRKKEVKGSPSSQKKKSSYIKKGTQVRCIRTEDGKFKCRQCDQTFARHSGLNGHEREKHPKTPGAFICDICGEAFNSQDYRRKHIKRTHESAAPVKNRKMLRTEDGKYQCRHCDQTFLSKSGCSAHEHEKHSKTPGAFVCDICGRGFNSASYLYSHKSCIHKLKADGTPIPKKAPTLERAHMCDLCGKGLSTPRQLRKHVRFVHEKRFDIKCTLCGLGCASRTALKKHLLAIHPEDPSSKQLIEEEGLGNWKCPVTGCTARFLKESSVKDHLRSIHGKDGEQLDLEALKVLGDPSLQVACPVCGKICGSKQSLRKHEKWVHENEGKEKKFICEICGGGFVSKAYLKIHVYRVHLKKGVKKGKDFKCEICGKGYADRYKLKGHMELHEREGKRDYFCDKCGHGFVTEQYLKLHKQRTNCGVEGKMARVYKRKGE